jgi:hypothetical protein
MPAVTAPGPVGKAMSHGARVATRELGLEAASATEPDAGAAQPMRVLREDGSLLAVAKRVGDRVHLLRVFGRQETPPGRPFFALLG